MTRHRACWGASVPLRGLASRRRTLVCGDRMGSPMAPDASMSNAPEAAVGDQCLTVMNAASSLVRKQIVPTTSCAVHVRLIACMLAIMLEIVRVSPCRSTWSEPGHDVMVSRHMMTRVVASRRILAAAPGGCAEGGGAGRRW